MNAMKRTLAALVVSGGAALVLTPVAAHADGTDLKGVPITQRVGSIVDRPGSAANDTKTAVDVTTSVAGSAAQATDSSLTGAGSALAAGLPKPPQVR
uniref:ATP-binding protein n=1 Tax=Streptomyces sp. NBC_00049 TaxID=2903617 RepID=A0AAU2JU09_9ACTN